MISPADKDYIETKKIKQGVLSLNPDFNNLAAWINNEYDVSVLNIFYEYEKGFPNNRFPSLGIIFEFEKDALKFKEDSFGNISTDKQQAVKSMFEKLVPGSTGSNNFLNLPSFSGSKKYETNRLFVSFYSFAPYAGIEATTLVTQTEIKNLKNELNNPDIWEITLNSWPVYFFFTDNQVKHAKESGYEQVLYYKLYQLVKKHDEFNYLNTENFRINLDSKEIFEKNYELLLHEVIRGSH